jgi:hypothetical protein
MRFMQAIHRAAGCVAVAAVLAFAGPAVYAQQQPQPSATALATANELITVTGATALFNPLIAGVVEQAKILFLQQDPSMSRDLNEVSAKLRADLQPRLSELTDEVARLYAAKFSEQELKEILAFYKSPTGKKLLAEQTQVIDSSMRFAQNWANKLSEEVISKMRDELKKKGHAL